MSTEEHYNAYHAAANAVVQSKEQLRTLRAQGEQAATLARNSTVGTLQEMLAAIRAAWKPFNERIILVEQSIKDNQAIADREFALWQGL